MTDQRHDVLCIIPARGGSKGLPGKNVKKLAGKPLIAYSIEAAAKSSVCDDVVVSTDSEDIAAAARAAGAWVPFLRPPELSTDAALTEPVLTHALTEIEKDFGYRYSIVVFLQATDVFRSPSWIRRAVEALRNDPALESAFSANETKKNFWVRNADGGQWERVLPEMASYMSRQSPKRRLLYREDTGLACATRAELIRAGRRIGDRVELIVNDDFRTGIDIHTPFDHWLAEQVIEKWGIPE
jgi:CMP-N,N'-diacetyllegionaminic acid synthase